MSLADELMLQLSSSKGGDAKQAMLIRSEPAGGLGVRLPCHWQPTSRGLHALLEGDHRTDMLFHVEWLLPRHRSRLTWLWNWLHGGFPVAISMTVQATDQTSAWRPCPSCLMISGAIQ